MAKENDMTKTLSPDDILGLDSVFEPDDLEFAAIVKKWLDENVRDRIGDYFLDATIPAREQVDGIGELVMLGMHLNGYGTVRSTTSQYGLAFRALEAVDSGLRSLVSVHGSRAMFAIHRFCSEAQKEEWLPKM